MSVPVQRHQGQLERELAYYQRECNDLGARLLGLQEEQSRAFREARRSRMVAKLIREAYRLADAGSSPEEIGLPMLGVIVENAMCDAAAFLAETKPGSGAFMITDVVGVSREQLEPAFCLPDPPGSFFTTAKSQISLASHELSKVLPVPFVFWAYDRPSGHALILGNRSESNVNRAFEAGDQELIEGALSVYLDVLSRKQAEFELRRAQASIEEINNANEVLLAAISDELSAPLQDLVDHAEKLYGVAGLGGRPEDMASVERIHGAGRLLGTLVAELAEYGSITRGQLPPARQPVDLADMVGEAVEANRPLAGALRSAVRICPIDPPLRIIADGGRLRLLVRTLVSSALRMCAPSGVAVEVTHSRNGTIEIAVRSDAGGSAAGIGAVPDRPFAGGGAGVNPGPAFSLPIARKLCEARAGWLVVEGAADRGAVIRAVLPDVPVA